MSVSIKRKPKCQFNWQNSRNPSALKVPPWIIANGGESKHKNKFTLWKLLNIFFVNLVEPVPTRAETCQGLLLHFLSTNCLFITWALPDIYTRYNCVNDYAFTFTRHLQEVVAGKHNDVQMSSVRCEQQLIIVPAHVSAHDQWAYSYDL